jgi:quercetin 2,3-dioxygenase
VKKGAEGKEGDEFYRMKRGDVQFTTGGTGISHSETNEGDVTVHFLQIWVLPWTRSLPPRYHTRTFDEQAKRQSFIPILSPLKAGPGASSEEEQIAEPSIPNTIPIHSDLVMSAGIIGVDRRFKYVVGGEGDTVRSKSNRKVYFHMPMAKNGHAKIRLDGRESAVLGEGDGAFVSEVNVGDVLSVESIGEAEAEVVILDGQ